MRSLRLRTLSAALLPLVFLAACGSDKASHAATGNPLDTVKVSASANAAPTLTLPKKPFTVTDTKTKVVTAGKGAAITTANAVTANYLLVNGKDGKQLDSSFGKQAASMDLSSGKLLSGLTKGLVGQKVGSRVLVAIPPKDAFGTSGNTQLGIGGSDTLVFLLDVVSASTPLTTATGTAVKPKAGLPTVTITDPKQAAKITIPKKPAPTKLVVQQLITGKGPQTKAGQTIKVSYTGVLWKNGKKFDASADHGGATEFPIGVKQVIPGWDIGLVGQPVGSRVLLIVPPAQGYGAKGSPPVISGTDTLVFVVDILDAH